MKRALWGEVSPALRAARIKWDNETIHTLFYYDGEISEEDHESAECIATEVIADYSKHQLKVDILRWDYPKPIPQVGELVYYRRESTVEISDKKSTLLSSHFSDHKHIKNLEAKALLSFCYSLVGKISPSLEAAAVCLDNSMLSCYFFYNDTFSDGDRKDLECVVTSVEAAFPNVKYATFFIEHGFLDLLPDLGVYAFSRSQQVSRQVKRSETLGWSIESQAMVSLCQALLGRTIRHLRMSEVTTTEDGFNLYFFLDVPGKAHDLALIQQVAEKVVADFPELRVNTYTKILPYPEALPQSGRYVFQRKESPSMKEN